MNPSTNGPWSAQDACAAASKMIAEVERALHGKSSVVRKSIICLLGRGHLLIEDVPGVGKTTLAMALARTIEAEFRRIQFTSDLLPSDLSGISIPDQMGSGETPRFRFVRGPLFGNLILAEAALSFLGAGVPSPTPTWGAMVSEGRNYLSSAWWPTVLPGVAIFMVVMSLNFTGDWLRDRLDPRLRQLVDN